MVIEVPRIYFFDRIQTEAIRIRKNKMYVLGMNLHKLYSTQGNNNP